MQKMIRVNEKRLVAKYNRRLFLAEIPAIAIIISLFAVTVVFDYCLKAEMPSEMYRAIFYAAYAACAYGFVICLTASILEEILIRAHREHTYIHIAGTVMIVSQHERTVFLDGKWVHYKKMWVVKLSDVENVECIKDHLTITAKARYFNENAQWLSYRRQGDGIAFDRWWYDRNGGKDVSVIEITDFYKYGERIARHIDACARKTRERESRRIAYHAEMMAIAKKTYHPKKLRDRYIPPPERMLKR